MPNRYIRKIYRSREVTINTLEISQIRSLYSQSYTANLAVLATGILAYVYLYYSGFHTNINLFSFILVASVIGRIALTFYANKSDNINLLKLAQAYAVISLIIGLDFSLLSITYYDIKDFNLKYFLMLIHIGFITSAIVTMSVWMTSYLMFVIPQLITLISIFVISESYSVALITTIFSGFILSIAKKYNQNFKETQVLINENITLISNMEDEIYNSSKAQQALETHKSKLEDIVESRTSELQAINEDLIEQIEIRNDIEKKLEYLAYYDELTDLPNRTLFIEKLKSSLAQVKRNNSLLAILFVDLDRFKKINDSHGHFIGDSLLKSVSERIKGVIRDSDTLARNGGDEFVLMLENMKDVREPYIVATKIIELMTEKFKIEGHDIHIGASVGISLYPLDSDDPLELLKMSDTAMFEAKKIGRNNFQFYSTAMSSDLEVRLKMENELRQALDKNEFFLMYQPQVDLNTNQTTGFEALLRWESPEFGLVPPFKFIPILEETGLIYDVGDWIILEALSFIKSGASQKAKVSINLSALQCGKSNFSEKIKKFIKDSDVDPSLVEFEITESLLISDFSKTEIFLTDISKLGCTIALDDFGTGYTSFTYLAKLPIDIIKIDRSFITDIDKKVDLQNIVKAIVTMSQSLGVENVFEGIETKEELNMVKQLQGKIIQGYYFSKPLKSSEIISWLKKAG